MQAHGVACVSLSGEVATGLPGGSRAGAADGLLDRQHDRDQLSRGEPRPAGGERPAHELARRPRRPVPGAAARHDAGGARGARAVARAVAARPRRRRSALLVAMHCSPSRSQAGPGRRRATRRARRRPSAWRRRPSRSRRRTPAGALQKARRALALTAEFVPTEYVAAGRKGEVVEDEFKAARDEYQRHRATLYEAVGSVLARQGQALPASRYQRRAFLLDPTPARGLALARSLNELGRGREALHTVQRAIAGLAGLLPEAAEVIVRAADVAGLPSAQAEIDRGRLGGDRSAPRSSCGRVRSTCLRASGSRRTPSSASTTPRSTSSTPRRPPAAAARPTSRSWRGRCRRACGC